MPDLTAAFFARNTTSVPEPMLQQTAAANTDANEAFMKGTGPTDVWLDSPVTSYIKQGSMAVDTPAHKKLCIQHEGEVYWSHKEVLHCIMANGQRKGVPPPHARADLVKRAHEQNGHFGIRRTTALLLPHYWWAGMGLNVRHMVNKCAVCDKVNAAFNSSTQQLYPLPIQGIFYRWGVDLAGPFNPISDSGNRYVW